MQQYSVLMSVYYKENPVCFRAAMESVLNQTVPPDDFVVVCDGPLTTELEGVLAEMTAAHPETIQAVRLKENRGIGYAANQGLAACKYDLVAKMDADDISVPDRCQRQLACFAEDPELSVCGGYIAEFEQDPACPFAIRTVPLCHEDIWKKGRRRQPFNNTTVMFRRSAVMAVGGYRDLRRNEDYDLYARLLYNGYLGKNIPQVLVLVRMDREAGTRRGSFATLRGCFQSRWRAYRMGYARLTDYLYCVAGQLFVTLCPGPLQQWLYMTFFREKYDNSAKPEKREDCCEDFTYQP